MNSGLPAMIKDESMLLVLPVPFRRVGDSLLFESQACNGVDRWADNFSSLVLACPLIPEHLVKEDSSQLWKDTREIASRDRVEFVPLPWAFNLGEFTRAYKPTRRLIGELIARCRYLQFAIAGLIGDWATVGAFEALKQHRPYALHVDIVNHVAARRQARGFGLKRRIKIAIEAPIMKQVHARLARNCALGLWHGFDCYQEYSRWSKNNFNVHDIHTKPEDCIRPEALEQKALEAMTAPALRACYTGRATTVKGPLDWVRAIAHAVSLGARVDATWLGDGPMYDEMRAAAAELGLGDRFHAPGFVTDRDAVLGAIRNAHIMPYAHLTPESPRCLLEALLSGTPIVGYDNAFAVDLTDGHGGGVFAPLHNWKKLGEEIARLDHDREALSRLIREAGQNGTRFNDAAVFEERSDLIKKYLP